MKFFFASLCLCALSSTAFAQNLRTSNQSEAQFLALAKPSALNIKGHGAKLRGELVLSEKEASGKFEVDAKGFTTDMGLRDTHLKEKVLKTKEHPKASFELLPIALPAGWKKGQPLKTKFKGNLTLVGVTKPIEGELKVDGPKLKTEAVFKINLTDFGIQPPSYMGMKVLPEVTITALIPAFGLPK